VTPDRWRAVTDLFHAALARDAAEREAFVDGACKDDASLRAEVARLLDAHQEAGSFGNRPGVSESVASLGAGCQLGAYRIDALIGRGGMGEVYRATDMRLGRTVAVKILPVHLRDSPDRQGRFDREARTISHLTHPHICTLHDIGHENGIDFLVMEHLEGETLAARLSRGAMPLEQALQMGIEVAAALHHAHRHGVIHRDLKPGNVMLTKSGAKLLDFGLARLDRRAALSAESAPTAPKPDTVAGTRLGTLPYMSPEQVEGKDADARSDLWAMGCLLYEALTGRKAFDSPSQAGLVAAILEREPEPLQRALLLGSPGLERAIGACLRKNADERWQSVADLKRELEWIAVDREVVEQQSEVKHRWRWPAVTVAIGSVALTVWSARLLTTAEPVPVHALVDVAPADEIYGGPAHRAINMTVGGSHAALSWTPDGRAIVFAGYKAGVQQLYLRTLDRDQAVAIAGTEGAYEPVVSSDGRWVAFWSAGAIRKVSLTGGASGVLVPNVKLMPAGMSWNAAGLLYSDRGQIWHLPPSGQPIPVLTSEGREYRYSLPSWLPDGRAFLYTARRREWTWGNDQTMVHTLSTGQRRVVLRDGVDARYVSGSLIFLRLGTAFAAPFDLSRLELRGEPLAVLTGVSQALRGMNTSLDTGAGQFAVSPDGSLAYVQGGLLPADQSRIVMVDLQGRVTPLSVPPGTYTGSLRLSPDGRQLLTLSAGLSEVSPLVIDLSRGALTTLAQLNEHWWPTWTADSKSVVSLRISDDDRAVVIQSADGRGPPERIADGAFVPASSSPDNRYILGIKNQDVWVFDRRGPEPRLRPVVESPLEERWPVFSPDGRWLAYGIVESDHGQIYVRGFPGAGPRAQISVDRGSNVAWNPNGRELFFVRTVNTAEALAGREQLRLQMLAAHIEDGVPIGVPRVLFEFAQADLPNFSCLPLRCFDVAPNGRGFYLVQAPRLAAPARAGHVHLVLNWMREVHARFRQAR
jgi:serine/threonine-protein kinase